MSGPIEVDGYGPIQVLGDVGEDSARLVAIDLPSLSRSPIGDGAVWRIVLDQTETLQLIAALANEAVRP